MYSPSADAKSVQVDPATCYNISLFKGKHVTRDVSPYFSCEETMLNLVVLLVELMREYRKVDDNVTMRLNRTVAQFRDRDRHSSAAHIPEEDACAFFWKDLVCVWNHIRNSSLSYSSFGIANWKKRTEIIQYCVAIVDQSIEDKQKTIETRELDADVEAQLKKASYAEGVRVRRNVSPA